MSPHSKESIQPDNFASIYSTVNAFSAFLPLYLLYLHTDVKWKG